MKASDIPDKFDQGFANSASPGFITYPIPDSPGATDRASLHEGFPPSTMAPGGKPFGQDFNGLFLQITLWSQWQAAGAPSFYDSGFSASIGGYPKGAVLSAISAVGWFWISIVDDNVSDPETGGANWVAYTPASLYAEDTGTANTVVASIIPAPPSLAALTGKPIVIKKAGLANSGGMTITLNGFTTQSVIHGDGTAIQNGEVPGGEPFTVVPDGSNFVLQSVANAATMLLPNSVTNAKLATMPDQTVKGNISGGTATPTDVPVSSLGAVPVGTVIAFALPAVPAGFLACDGSSLLRASYPALNTYLAVGGYPYGSADGTHFNLPDFRAMFLRGYFGALTGAYGVEQLDAIKAHTHTVPWFTDNTPTTGPGHGGTTSGTPATSGSTGGTETRPVNFAVNYCIKY